MKKVGFFLHIKTISAGFPDVKDVHSRSLILRVSRTEAQVTTSHCLISHLFYIIFPK